MRRGADEPADAGAVPGRADGVQECGQLPLLPAAAARHRVAPAGSRRPLTPHSLDVRNPDAMHLRHTCDGMHMLGAPQL